MSESVIKEATQAGFEILVTRINSTGDTRTPDCAAKEIVVPDWVQYEIDHPAGEGERNNQCIKIGPAILRAGGTPQQLADILSDMHPDLDWSEIDNVVRSSARYARMDATALTNEEIRRRRRLFNDAAIALPRILKKYARPVPSAPGRSLRDQRLLFLTSLFDLNDVLWIGDIHQRKLNTLEGWLRKRFIPGCFVGHSTFKAGSRSRSNKNVDKRKYLVVESDKLPHHEAMAVFGALEELHGLTLRSLVTSGRRSLHAWFDWPKEGEQADWQAVIEGYQCDPANLRPSQPVRLPGIIRPETGRPQQLILP